MIKPEQVPKEAIEAAAVHISNGRTTSQAIAAALNAWPGWYTEGYSEPHLILPLTQENENG